MDDNRLEIELLHKLYIVAAVLNFSKREIADCADSIMVETLMDVLGKVDFNELAAKYDNDEFNTKAEDAVMKSVLMDLFQAFDHYVEEAKDEIID